MMTYGDGVADIDMDELLKFHQEKRSACYPDRSSCRTAFRCVGY